MRHLVAAILGIVGIVVGAASGLWSARRNRHLNSRSQAGRVSAHIERTAMGAACVVQNRSSRPVRDLRVMVGNLELASPSLMPGEGWHTTMKTFKGDDRLGPVLEFTDSAYHRWRTSDDGLYQKNGEGVDSKGETSISFPVVSVTAALCLVFVITIVVILVFANR